LKTDLPIKEIYSLIERVSFYKMNFLVYPKLNKIFGFQLILLIIFISILLTPNLPFKDEIIFYHDIKMFAKQGLTYSLQMKSAHGPFFLFCMSLFYKFFGFSSILPLRLINFLLVIILFDLIKKWNSYFQIPDFAVIQFFFNPYFLLLTSVLIYSDNFSMLLVLYGYYCFIKEEHLKVILFFSIAILTRQTVFLALIPIYLILLFDTKGLNKYLKLLYLLPLILLGTLIYLWNGNLMSPNVSKPYQFYKTVKGFDLSPLDILKSIIYQLFYIGMLGILFIKSKLDVWKVFTFFTLTMIIFFVNPTNINYKYHHEIALLYDAGYLDRVIKMLYPLSFILMAFIINFTLWNVWENRKVLLFDRISALIFLFIVFNIGFYSISSFWDKYYIVMGLLVPTMIYRINSFNDLKQIGKQQKF
jgi:4-amino-4-deoxy-L-arabinose transferase-like glycosyltransferase